MLKISIVTVVKNGERYLEETILSVVNQTYKNIEYIIIDGESEDASCEIIRKYEKQVAYWSSQKDNSMYDAINKGLDKTTGDYVLILNSDDTLTDGSVVEKIVTLMKKGYGAYYGNFVKRRDDKLRYIRLFQISYLGLLCSEHGTLAPHPAFLISRKMMQQVPYYDCNYRYGADYDYILKVFKRADKVKHLNVFISNFRLHPGSITSSGVIDNDRINVLKAHDYYAIGRVKRKLIYYYVWCKYKFINGGKTRL